jgi:hypothetical protein
LVYVTLEIEQRENKDEGDITKRKGERQMGRRGRDGVKVQVREGESEAIK